MDIEDGTDRVPPVGPGLTVVRDPDLDVLAARLGQRLASAPPADPLATIEVAIPNAGQQRWLLQRLGHHLGATDDEAGVASGLDMPFVGSVIARTVDAAVGADGEQDLWQPDRLVWPLVELLDDLGDDPVHAPLVAHLREGEGRRRLPLARRIADLFDRYALYRPEMVRQWAAGRAVDAQGRPLSAALAWQPRLWQRLAAILPVASPEQRLDEAVAALVGGRAARPDDLPGPVTVFGVLGLPARHLDVLLALSHRTSVELLLVSPVPAWDEDALPGTRVPNNPLLVASGVAAAEAGRVLRERLPAEVLAIQPAPSDRADRPAGERLLDVLRDDLRHDRRRAPDGDVPPVELHDHDRSVVVHACHGLVRQLEVLREQLLTLLEEDPSLQPRDIVVLAPDVAAVAPLIGAAFPAAGAEVEEGPPALPIRVADRSVQPGNLVADALQRTLALVGARITATDVLDLLARSPLRSRFGLVDGDLTALETWVSGTGIRWGVDGAHREDVLGLEGDAHTWAAGLDRLALGAAMSDDGLQSVGGVVPYDDVEGSGVQRLGRVVVAVEEVFATLGRLRGSRSPSGWAEALLDAVSALCDAGVDGRGDADLADDLSEARATVRDAFAAAGDRGIDLTVEETRLLLDERFARGGGRTAYGTGAVTVSGFVPLRNLPHRVVCLVGMDDGALPRPVMELGFDLLALDPQAGDPDPRAEDRQQFLDAVLAARDHLVITYTGRDPRTNEVSPPAVPVGELLDVLDEAVSPGPGGASARRRLVVEHPLQPYATAYFTGRPGDSGAAPRAAGEAAPVPRAFDRRHLAAATASVEPGERVGFLDRPLPAIEGAAPQAVVRLEDLISSLQHPPRRTLRERLGLSLGEDDPRPDDRDPLELAGLQRWQVSQDLLDRELLGGCREGWRPRLLATGTVPVGGLGAVDLDEVEARVDAVVAAARELDGPSREVAIDVLVPVPTGGTVRLLGSVTVTGDRLLTAQMSRINAKHRLAAWIRLLAVLAAEPGSHLTAHLIGPPDKGSDEATSCILDPARLSTTDPDTSDPDSPDAAAPGDVAPDPDDPEPVDPDRVDPDTGAVDHLGVLLALHQRGEQEVLPYLPDTTAAYVAARVEGKDEDQALVAARKAWTPWNRPGDGQDPYVVQAYGADPEVEDVLGPGDRPEAEALWGPIVRAEVPG